MVAKKGAGFQRPWLHSGRIRGGITQLPGDATAVIGCSTWVKRAFILPILLRGNQTFHPTIANPNNNVVMQDKQDQKRP
jgi:hypothetical protein